MIRFVFVFIILAIMWVGIPLPVYAESYSAFEPGSEKTAEITVEALETAPLNAPAIQKVQKNVTASRPTTTLTNSEKQRLEKKIAELENEIKTLQSKNEKRDQFETVPKQHAGSVTARLKLVGEILRHYGRAYDYRSLTQKELASILNQLDQENFWSN